VKSTSDTTVICDGSGYKVQLGSAVNLQWQAMGCAEKHERAHIADLMEICPEGCTDKEKGTPHPTGDDPRGCPPFEDKGTYAQWRATTECHGYSVEEECLVEQFKSADAQGKVAIRNRLNKHVRRSLKYWKC